MPNISKTIAFIISICSVIAMGYSGYAWFTAKIHHHDLNGQWKFTFTIESSSLKRYDGMAVAYRIFITDDDGKINGKGEKWWVNDKVIPYAQHDRFEFVGTNKDNMLKCTYKLFGKIATTTGGFDMKIKDDKSMEGTYAGTAADTKGHVIPVVRSLSKA